MDSEAQIVDLLPIADIKTSNVIVDFERKAETKRVVGISTEIQLTNLMTQVIDGYFFKITGKSDIWPKSIDKVEIQTFKLDEVNDSPDIRFVADDGGSYHTSPLLDLYVSPPLDAYKGKPTQEMVAVRLCKDYLGFLLDTSEKVKLFFEKVKNEENDDLSKRLIIINGHGGSDKGQHVIGEVDKYTRKIGKGDDAKSVYSLIKDLPGDGITVQNGNYFYTEDMLTVITQKYPDCAAVMIGACNVDNVRPQKTEDWANRKVTLWPMGGFAETGLGPKTWDPMIIC